MNVEQRNERVSRTVFKHTYGYGEADELGGTSGILFIHNVSVNLDRRGLGLGSLYHMERLTWAKNNGYKYVMCTVEIYNDRQQAIMKKFGWKRAFKFAGLGMQLFIKEL